jgi:DNA modification methylase
VTALVVRGDARRLPLPDQSVDLIVTSPPYFALRSYTDTPELCDRCRELIGEGWVYYRPRDHDRNLREAWPDWDAHVAAEHKQAHYDGQIGSEPTPAEYLDALWACTREWMRVLKPEGSLWVNLGDKYNAYNGGRGPGTLQDNEPRQIVPRGHGLDVKDVRPKSLLGIPWRYAIGCIDQLGLILRAELIWSKPNGLPESATDRVRRSHEQWFHMVKQPRYYAAVDEIREAQVAYTTATGTVRYRKPGETAGEPLAIPSKSLASGTMQKGRLNGRGKPGEFVRTNNPLGKLPGSVWSIPSEPLTVPAGLGVDHFAAFPTEWPRRLILGWSPPGICTACGQGRRPVVDKQGPDPELLARRGYSKHKWSEVGPRGRLNSYNINSTESSLSTTTITGYACACPEPTAPTRPAIILDPFGGTGTTALVAHALGRTGITVDMSADYSRLARWRTSDRGELAKAMRVSKPAPVPDGQLDMFSEVTG